MADATLTTQPRTAAGKRSAGRIRAEGLVPAVVYGQKEAAQSVTVSSRELSHILSGASGLNTLITLKIDGGSQLALARQIQRHPVKGTLIHVDFVRVRADQTIQAEVPVGLRGEAEGVNRGGILEQMIHTLTVEARPGDIPTVIEHDITDLEIGSGFYVRDLAIPAGVTVLQNEDELVAQISAPRVIEEEAAAEGEGVEGEAAAPAEGAPTPEASSES